MTLLWNLELLNHNSQRAFPLAPHAARTDTTGTITLPNSFLVGMELTVHAGLSVDPSKIFLYSVLISPVGFSLAFAYDDGTPTLVATTNFARSTHAEYDSYALVGKNNFDDCVGHVLIGDLTEIDELPAGEYFFTAAAGAVDPHAIMPGIRSITSITVVNGNDRSERYYGDITLVAGTNFRITATSGDSPTIVFNAISGEGLNQACVCDQLQDAPCIRTINGIPGDPDGNFRIDGNQCITLTPASFGLELLNECSTPCCGCAELEALRSQLNDFADGRAALQSLADRTHSEVSTMTLVVLASKVGDSGCPEEEVCPEESEA
jgi:hypothetical protein